MKITSKKSIDVNIYFQYVVMGDIRQLVQSMFDRLPITSTP